MLDKYAQKLAPAEREAIWERISRSRTAGSHAVSRWPMRALAATAAAAALAVVFVAQRHEPGGPVQPLASRTARVPGVAPTPPAAGAGAATAPEPAAPQGATTAPEPATPPVATSAPSPASAGAAGSTGALSGRVTDSHSQPVPFANVVVKGTRTGTTTREDGTFRIEHLPPATYAIQVRALGYEAEELPGVRVEGEQSATADIRLKERVVQSVQEVAVTAERGIDTKSSATKQSISAERLREIPVDNLREAVSMKAGTVAKEGPLHFRGGRGAETKYQFDGLEAIAAPSPVAAATPAPPPVVPTTGGTKLPNDEPYDSMFFKNYGVNPFISTDEDALSTFAVDVDAASYTVARRYLRLGQLPPADAVRVEEFVNFFPQDYPKFYNEDFRIQVDGAPSPFGAGYQLLRIGIQGRVIAERDRKPALLTFVIDVSGSMSREDRLELVKRALRLLVDQLRDDDRVGIVVYGSTGRVLLEPVALREHGARERILEAIGRLVPEGSTNAEEGLRLAYDMARRGYRAKAINRIVLCSDGVANVGVTGPESILADVRTGADRGIHLTTIGFGMGNYNDVLMEQLADRGDGNHYYVDEIGEARRVFVEKLTGTLETIAKDAKVQVEFDSTRVVRYRLLGFENRDVADRDFRNDKVDAGEIGAGHEVTALYEVKLAPRVTQGTIATVRFRYARPEQQGGGAPQVREMERRFDAAALGHRFEDAAPRFRLDAAVAEFAEILRGSYWARDGRLSDVLSVARDAARDLQDEASTEFVTLVERAATLGAMPKAGARSGER
jgi:Ca-activated chloride channel family protein